MFDSKTSKKDLSNTILKYIVQDVPMSEISSQTVASVVFKSYSALKSEHSSLIVVLLTFLHLNKKNLYI